MKEITNKEIEKLEKERDELYNKAHEISDKIKDLKIKEVNLNGFEGKYIKYEDEEGFPEYMHVNWVTKETLRHSNFDYSYMLRGLGFYGEFTGYGDATQFFWSYWDEIYIYGDGDDFKEKVKKIKIITKEEFDEAFEKVLEQVKHYHYKHKDKKDE